MKTCMLNLIIPLLVAPIFAAQAQVYQTTDEEGNTVFTDVPPSKNAKPLEVESTNIAESVEVRPPAPDEEPPRAPSAASAPPTQSPVIIGGDDDLGEELYEERRRREIREQIGDRPAQTPPSARPLPAARPGGRR